jgi:hypothetical protein
MPEQYHIMRKPTGNHGQYTSLGKFKINTINEGVRVKFVYDWTSWFNVTIGETNQVVPVLQIKHPRTHFTHILKRNIDLILMPSLNVINPIIPVVANTIIVKKKAVYINHLNPYVAKQLLILSQQNKQMCPITAEEFAEGHTAVMPCGHLFVRMAIEESFKSRPNECPLCRLGGTPCLV